MLRTPSIQTLDSFQTERIDFTILAGILTEIGADNGKKADLTATKLLPWDEYMGKPAEQVLPLMYSRVEATSKEICAWYWQSIKAS